MRAKELPLKLQERFKQSKNSKSGVLDLSNCSLADLSDEGWRALEHVLQEHTPLKELKLNGCDLASRQGRVWELEFFLKNLYELEKIDLSHNRLSFDKERIKYVYKALSGLPRLHTL